MELKEYRALEPWLDDLLLKDPVRPSIPPADRFGPNHMVFVLWQDEQPSAICCAALLDYVPVDEVELFYDGHEHYDHACLYTIWAMRPKAGRALATRLVPHLRQKYSVSRVVTLSPDTAMAKRFHLNNGAVIFRENEEFQTVNYEYEAV